MIGNKTTDIHKQNTEPNGYFKVFELDNVLKTGYFESPLGYNNVDWFVEEVMKL